MVMVLMIVAVLVAQSIAIRVFHLVSLSDIITVGDGSEVFRQRGYQGWCWRVLITTLAFSLLLNKHINDKYHNLKVKQVKYFTKMHALKRTILFLGKKRGATLF